MTPTPEQVALLRKALRLSPSGVPSGPPWFYINKDEAAAFEPMIAAGLVEQARIAAMVTAAGVRAVCPGARTAVYVPTGDEVTLFESAKGKYRIRWEGPGKGRFQRGVVYPVSRNAVRETGDATGQNGATDG